MHPWGSMQTYLARCAGAGGCAQADPTALDWFKIGAIGQSRPHANVWYMAELRTSGPMLRAPRDADARAVNGDATSIVLPPDLAPGDYLLRHELMAKHVAPPEFFISCASLRVGGAGTAAPAPAETARFPGAYAPTDAGIALDVFDGPFDFVFPGPPLSALADARFAMLPQLVAGATPLAQGVPAGSAVAGTGNAGALKAASAPAPSSSSAASKPITSTSSSTPKPTTSAKTVTVHDTVTRTVTKTVSASHSKRTARAPGPRVLSRVMRALA
jgi:hypothetical protein